MFWGRQNRSKGRTLAYYVDPEKIAEAKRNAPIHAGSGVDVGGLEYVSTNDILTSYFGQATSARLLMMTINYRGRGQSLAAIGNADAGNYDGVVLNDRDGFATPGKLRQSLRAGMPFRRVGTRPLPGMCGSCRWQRSAHGPSLNSVTLSETMPPTKHDHTLVVGTNRMP